MKLIDKNKLLEGLKNLKQNLSASPIVVIEDVESLIESLEVKELDIDIPNIDDLLEEDGIDPNSKEAKAFKESYYMALEKLKEKKGE